MAEDMPPQKHVEVIGEQNSSDSDSESEEKESWIPFSQRSEWADVAPIPQDDGPFPVCPIAYSKRFSETMDYFRAILRKDERSPRALELTTDVIKLNPANYTAWHFRRLCLEALHSDFERELEFVETVCEKHPKNYQIWYHRRTLLERLKQIRRNVNVHKELDFIVRIFKDDNKNYHAWAHRQWVLQTFGVWDKEMELIESLLKEDLRNNSVWNHRYFVISKTTPFDKQTKQQEIEYAMKWIRLAPNNPSPWAYLNGMVKDDQYANFPIIEGFCREAKEKWVTCIGALATLIDICEEDAVREKNKSKIEEAVTYCESLASHVDEIHRKYWNWKKEQLLSLKLV